MRETTSVAEAILRAEDRPLPSTLLIAAHPDDETLGAGGLLSSFSQLKLLYTTDGAPYNPEWTFKAGFETREEYRLARQEELLRALTLAGLDLSIGRFLPFADQEISHRLPELVLGITTCIRQENPDWILTHSYEGGHPDHDSTTFAIHAARYLAAVRGESFPFVIEFTGYHSREGAFTVSAFLPSTEMEIILPLSGERSRSKAQILSQFSTQQDMLSQFPNDRELFRAAPLYDFAQPPHAGRVWYDGFDWGITFDQWLENVRETLDLLGVDSTVL